MSKLTVVVGNNFTQLKAIAQNMEDGWDAEKGLVKEESFKVYYGESYIGEFALAPMPGCCGITVSIHSLLFPRYRGQHHISQSFHKLKAETARRLGYSAMIATAELRNIPETVGAAKAGWKIPFTWRNSRTSHDLGLLVRAI